VLLTRDARVYTISCHVHVYRIIYTIIYTNMVAMMKFGARIKNLRRSRVRGPV